MSRVVFYRLCAKFVDNERSVPKETSDVLYYTLAVGHHTGIIDCFSESFSCSQDVYERIIGLFPPESDAHYKLDGIRRKGEIQIDKSHLDVFDTSVNDARASLDALDVLDVGDEAYTAMRDWLDGFSLSLDDMKCHPEVYLMGRTREA
ncbi:MAG: hypothetical protein LBL27_03390 [Coriobacteriales bacterium]|jgi:hypothetical protein|nr:hypothetical protein [Coriobacteriales bacterium]